MNVLLVSQPPRDGVLRHVIGLADYLIAQGDRVHLAYSEVDGCDQLFSLVDRVQASGGRTLELGIRNAPQPRDVPALMKLVALIRRERPDVIHGHSSKAGAYVRGLGLLGVQTPLFYTPNSYYRMHDPASPKARVFHALERLFSRVGTTITMSRCESTFAERVIGVPVARQLICGNGVDFARFRPATPEAKMKLRAELGLPAGGKILGSVGRFSQQKDPLTMYAAVAEAAEEFPDVFFVHVGQGELEAKVDALIAARGLAGRCKRLPYLNDTSPFYQALDGFLLTSLYEGMSYAVLEALASNLPLVLTNAPGNDDFADHGFSHLEWCEPGNVASVTRGIRAWHEALELGAAPNHREVALRSFSLDVCYEPVRRAYRTAVGSGSLTGAP